MKLFLHGVFIINTLFQPILETLYAGHVKPSAEASRLYTHAVFQPRRPQNGFLGVHPSVGERGGGQRVLNRDCRENEGEESTPLLQCPVGRPVCGLALSCKRTLPIFLFGRTLRICFSNFFNVCTNRSELNVAPLSKNYANKVPLLSQ